jgi:[ribosomal protein S5]-alanine N-acetyltransferase
VPATWESERLLLRQLGPEAAAAVRDYGLRCRVFHAQWDPTRPRDYWELPVVAERLHAQIIEAEQGRSLCTYLSAKSAPEHVIGALNLRNIVRGELMSCVIGYGLAPEAVGNGFMSESIDRIVRVAFDEIGLHRLEINIIPRNARSIAVAERCGFVREGVSPRYLKIAGRWEDHARYALLNENRR